MRPVEDPSIAWCASVEFDRVWQRIEEQCATGAWFFRVRETVLAEEVPAMSKRYGRAVADRVSRVIQSKGPGDLSRATLRAARAALRLSDAKMRAGPARGPGPLRRLMDRLLRR